MYELCPPLAAIMKTTFLITALAIASCLTHTRLSFGQSIVNQGITDSKSDSTSYTLKNVIGTSASGSFSGDVKLFSNSVVNIKEDSFIQNRFGGEDGTASLSYTDLGATKLLQIEGINAENEFILDEGTSFTSSIESGENESDLENNTGTTSALLIQETTIEYTEKAEESLSSFQQAF